MRRFLKWLSGVLAALILLILLLALIFDWNWLRGPISRMVTDKTGRELAIHGDLKVNLGWPLTRIRAANVTFANPSWAKEKQMINVQEVEIRLDLPHLLKKELIMPEVRLGGAEVYLEQKGNKKNWLLDRNQQDEKARVQIGHLMLDHGRLGYDNVTQKTSIQSELSTRDTARGKVGDGNVEFIAHGQYKGLALNARGMGGPVLALRDENAPYPLTLDASIGHTTLHAQGSITSLVNFSAIDMQLTLRGASLAQLYPLLGIAFPETPAYSTQGHIAHQAQVWRYEKFSGRIGKSDIAGTLQVDTDGKRPYLHGDMVSQLLDFADLGPVIGAKSGASAAQTHALPDMPFHTERWNSVDADVNLKAKALRRAQALPVDNLVAHIKMRDSVLTLDPLNFGVAGGNLSTTVVLEGNQNPIRAHLKMQAHRMLIRKLFPTFNLNKTSIGQVNGAFDLTGTGNSIARMLATANGEAALVVADGEVSKLMMETVSLHLWEMLHLKLTGDKVVKINCGIADFNVKQGLMSIKVMLLDTAVTRIDVYGSIDLGQETLDLTLTPQTKQTSLIALRTPIYIRGTLSQPKISIDKAQLAMRSLGAIALGAVNPLLALLPLVEAGPGKDSQCGKLIRDAQLAVPKK